MNNQPGKNRVVMLSIISLVVIVVVVGLIVMFAKDRVQIARQNDTQVPQETGEQVQSTISGRLGLSTKGSTTEFRQGQQVTLFVYANSNAQEIIGYDAVIRYNTDEVEFESVKSVLDGMEVFESVQPVGETQSELIVTGIQSLNQETPFVLDDTALAEVTFTVLTSGPVDLELMFEPGSNQESNLRTASNQDILSTVTGTTLNEQ